MPRTNSRIWMHRPESNILRPRLNSSSLPKLLLECNLSCSSKCLWIVASRPSSNYPKTLRVQEERQKDVWTIF